MNDNAPGRPSAFARVGLAILAALLFVGFGSLGIWQVHRLSWKRDLIARVNARIHAIPVAAPRVADRSDEYRRVTVSGRFRHNGTTLVQASTALGSGYWVMTPLVRNDGGTLLINRGFVPPQEKTRYTRPSGPVRVTGLLRLSEPGGGFLRSNDTAANRWYSRDVAAIAAARHLAPPLGSYFIDADAGARGALPIGGLTVVQFPNNHLVYALTWFALAGMTAAAYIMLMRHSLKARSS